MAIEASTLVETPDNCAVTTSAKAATQTMGLVGIDVKKGLNDETGVVGDIPKDGRTGPLDGVDVSMEAIPAII